MTSVKGPFTFTSDRWSDSFVQKAKSAKCGSIALQLGVAPVHAANVARAAGLQIIGWGICDATTRAQLGTMGADVFMPQAENEAQFNSMIATCREVRAASRTLPIEPVMTAGGIDIAGSDAQKVANRQFRRQLMDEVGIVHVWVEVYKQDADRSGQQNLGDVNRMIAFFENDLLFGAGCAHPVIGLWTVDASEPWAKNPYSVSKYDLTQHGRTFGAWRAEQMADARYPEIAAVPASAPPPPPPPTGPTTTEARALVVDTVRDWRERYGKPEPLSRLTISERACSNEFTKEEWNRMAPTIKALMDLAHQ